MRNARSRIIALSMFTLALAEPLAAQDVMVGTRWSVHQQDRDSGAAWVFLDDGKLRVVTGRDSTSSDGWQWKADSIEITLAGRGRFVGMLVGPRLAGTRDEGKPDEGWWYADQVGGPNVTPEGLADTGAVVDSAPSGSAATPRSRRRRGVMSRGEVAAGGAAEARGEGFWGPWTGGARLGLQFSLDGGVGYGWVGADGAVTRGRGKWQRVQRSIVVRIKDAAGADLVIRGEVRVRAFVGQATLGDGTTTQVILRRRVAGGTEPAGADSVGR
ncbi:MAG: hypothetical protein WBC97_03690 [Gemmatimonadales bacterium]